MGARQMGESTRTAAGEADAPRPDDAHSRLARTKGTGRGRRWWRAALVVALLAVLAAGSALTSRWLAGRSGSPTIATTFHVPPPVELPVFRDGQTCDTSAQASSSSGCRLDDQFCPQTVAWSPAEQQAAILSYCGGFHGTSTKILVYDTATGHLRATVALDDIVDQASNVTGNCHVEFREKALDALGLFWLPSGRLAVVGSLYLWTADQAQFSCPPWDALVLVDADGTHPQVVLAPSRTYQDSDGTMFPCGRTWDLQTNSPAVGAEGSDCVLAPALGYRWADGGVLQPVTPLNDTTAPPLPGLSPVGNPAGDAQFTIWQSATVSRHRLADLFDATPDLYTLDEPLGALSPGGRYAYAGWGLEFRLQPAGQQPPSASDLQQTGWASTPLLPMKDTALQHVLAELPPPVPLPTPVVVSPPAPMFDSLPTALAWRPDGAPLAALGTSFERGRIGQVTDVHQAVQVLDCASGTVRLSLTPLADPSHKQQFALGPLSSILSWSPDGSRLLLISGARGTATLWDLRGLR